MNKQIIKSILTNARLRLVAATCLILAGLTLPTAELARASEGRGGPPGPITTVTVFIPASVCGFPVQATATERLGVIDLPGGGVVITYPATTAVFTNLSDPTKSVTINGFTGPAIVTFDQNGNAIVRGLGRGTIWDPATPGFGIRFQEGDFTQVFDPNGNLLSETRNGRVTNVCDLIN
jgi:hypothetical protein